MHTLEKNTIRVVSPVKQSRHCRECGRIIPDPHARSSEALIPLHPGGNRDGFGEGRKFYTPARPLYVPPSTQLQTSPVADIILGEGNFTNYMISRVHVKHFISLRNVRLWASVQPLLPSSKP